MTEASYVAWDDNLYEWPPPEGWYKSSDGKWWPEGYGPGQADSASSSTEAQTVGQATASDAVSNAASFSSAAPSSNAAIDGPAEAPSGLNVDQTSILPAGGVSSFAKAVDHDEAESQRPVYDELPPIDDIFGLSGDEDDDDLSGLSSAGESASAESDGNNLFDGEGGDDGGDQGESPAVDDLIGGEDEDDHDHAAGLNDLGNADEQAELAQQEDVSFSVDSEVGAAAGIDLDEPNDAAGGYEAAHEDAHDQEDGYLDDLNDQNGHLDDAPAYEEGHQDDALDYEDGDQDDARDRVDAHDHGDGRLDVADDHDDVQDHGVHRDDAHDHDDGHQDDARDRDDAQDDFDHHDDGHQDDDGYDDGEPEDRHGLEPQPFGDDDDVNGESQPDSNDDYLATEADAVAVSSPSDHLSAAEATVVVDDVAPAAATQVAAAFDSPPGGASDSATIAAVPHRSPQPPPQAVTSVAGQLPGAADLTQTIVTGDDATSTSLEVGYGETSSADEDTFEPAPRAKWPLIVGGLLLLAMASGLIYLIATADDELEAATPTESTVVSTGPGSLGEPYVFGTGVVVFYEVDGVQNRWVLQVLDPVADLTDDLTAAGVAAPEGNDILAAARVRVTFQSGVAAGPVSDLGLDATVAPDSLFVGLTDCGPESLDQALTLEADQSVEATVCWAVPASQLSGLILAVTAGPADGTVHLSLR